MSEGIEYQVCLKANTKFRGETVGIHLVYGVTKLKRKHFRLHTCLEIEMPLWRRRQSVRFILVTTVYKQNHLFFKNIYSGGAKHQPACDHWRRFGWTGPWFNLGSEPEYLRDGELPPLRYRYTGTHCLSCSTQDSRFKI